MRLSPRRRSPSAQVDTARLFHARASSGESASEAVADRERRTYRALGIVLVRDRSAEDGHHRVPDEPLDGAAEALELAADARVVGLQEPPHVLGVHRLRTCREADEVAEETGDDLALLAGWCRGVERRRAL